MIAKNDVLVKISDDLRQNGRFDVNRRIAILSSERDGILREISNLETKISNMDREHGRDRASHKTGRINIKSWSKKRNDYIEKRANIGRELQVRNRRLSQITPKLKALRYDGGDVSQCIQYIAMMCFENNEILKQLIKDK